MIYLAICKEYFLLEFKVKVFVIGEYLLFQAYAVFLNKSTAFNISTYVNLGSSERFN